MMLNISSGNLVRLEIEGSSLKCFKNNGNIYTYSLEGITKLWCHSNQLLELPKLPESIEQLFCSHNRLQSLPELPKTLKKLWCIDNQLSSLPILPSSLKLLSCESNQLLALPELPNTLRKLVCGNNHLIVLPKLPESLKQLYCSKNPLIFITPLSKRPFWYYIPKRLQLLHSVENYPKYYNRYQSYIYLITYLTLSNISPVILRNEAWWFPGII